MGGQATKAKLNKHVVIVGGSYAGFNLAIELYDILNVTIIDKRPFFENTTLLPRCMVDENLYTEKLVFNFDEAQKMHHNKFNFIQGSLTTVNRGNSITITRPDGQTQ